MFGAFRIIATLLYLWFVGRETHGLSGNTSPLMAGWVIIELVLLGLVTVTMWVPVVGEQLSNPLTFSLVNETSVPRTNRVVRWIHRCQARGWHRLALMWCLWEGLCKPRLPHPALLGIKSARHGSSLEKWLAREIYRHNNLQNCLTAWKILREHHQETPPPHVNPEVTLALMQLQRRPSPEHPPVPVPHRPQPAALARNPHIKLFRMRTERMAQRTETRPAGCVSEEQVN